MPNYGHVSAEERPAGMSSGIAIVPTPHNNVTRRTVEALKDCPASKRFAKSGPNLATRSAPWPRQIHAVTPRTQPIQSVHARYCQVPVGWLAGMKHRGELAPLVTVRSSFNANNAINHAAANHTNLSASTASMPPAAKSFGIRARAIAAFTRTTAMTTIAK